MAVAAIVAALIVIASLGTALPSSPLLNKSLDGPVCADSNGQITAIADSESRRVLVFDDQTRLVGIFDCTAFDSPIDAVIDVCVAGEQVYVAGVTFRADSEIIETERIVALDKTGNPLSVVLEIAGTARVSASLYSLSDEPDGVAVAQDIVAQSSEGDASFWPEGLEVVHVGLGGVQGRSKLTDKSNYPVDVGYSYTRDAYATLNAYGWLEMGGGTLTMQQRLFTSVDMGDNGLAYACDDVSGALCAVTGSGAVKELIAGEGFDWVHVNGDTISVCDRESDTVILCDPDGQIQKTITAFELAPMPFAHVILVWLCVVFLLGLLVVLAFRKLRAVLASGDVSGLGAVGASLAVVAAVALAIGNLSLASYQASIDTRANEVGMCADYLSTDPGNLSEAIGKCNYREALWDDGEDAFTESFEGFIDLFIAMENLSESAMRNNIGMYYVVYGKDDRGIFYMIDSASEHVFGASYLPLEDNSPVSRAFSGDASAVDQLFSGRALRDETRYRLVPVLSAESNEVIGVVEIGSKLHSLQSALITDIARRVLALLVLVMVLYLCYSELKACGTCLYSYRRLQEKRARDAVAVLTRPFTFCITTLMSIDSVMTVLIARDLLHSAGIVGDSTPLLALPAIMLGLGLMIGQGLYGLMGSKVPLRRLVARGAIAMLLCALFTALAVRSGFFWLYCLAKLTMSVPFGMLYTLGYSLPRVAETQETQKAAASGVMHTDTSAAAFGVVLGGYAASALGNAWVYILVAAACLPVLFMAYSLLPRDAAPLEELDAESSSERQGALRFVRSRPAIAITLLLVLPVTLATGYSSFLFPLFSAHAGLLTSDINNIYVIGQIIVFACIGIVSRTRASLGPKRIACAALALLGIVFLLFSFNTKLVWSVVVVILVGVLAKAIQAWKGIWLDTAKKAGVPAGQATGAMFSAMRAAMVAQPFILGALISFGVGTAVVVIGVYFLISAYLYWNKGPA